MCAAVCYALAYCSGKLAGTDRQRLVLESTRYSTGTYLCPFSCGVTGTLALQSDEMCDTEVLGRKCAVQSSIMWCQACARKRGGRAERVNVVLRLGMLVGTSLDEITAHMRTCRLNPTPQ
eukprot:2045834-Rhodomonas_salina.1